MGSILGEKRVGNKRKKSRSPAIASRWVKGVNKSNYFSVTCELFYGKGGYTWILCENTHKCKKCLSKNYRLIECMAKRRKKSWQYEAKGIKVTIKRVKIVEIASLANRNILCQFMCAYWYLPALFRPNIYIKFRFANGFKAILINFPFI